MRPYFCLNHITSLLAQSIKPAPFLPNFRQVLVRLHYKFKDREASDRHPLNQLGIIIGFDGRNPVAYFSTMR